MKKWISFILAVILVIGIMPTTALATENTTSMQDLAQAIKNNSTAEIRDADGNVVETLNVEVQIQQLPSSRSTDGGNTYAITCTAVASNDDYDNLSGSETSGGIMASATLVFTDVWGVDNILHQVYGSWSGDEDDTKDRWVIYYSYDSDDVETDSAPDYAAPQSFHYEPTGFKGLTFKVWTKATIVSTDKSLYLTVSTDPDV